MHAGTQHSGMVACPTMYLKNPVQLATSPSLLLLPDPLENSFGKGGMAEPGTRSSKTFR